MSGPWEIQYDEVKLSDMVAYFVKGYSKTPGTIEDYEWFIDPVKGKVIIRLYISGVAAPPGGVPTC